MKLTTAISIFVILLNLCATLPLLFMINKNIDKQNLKTPKIDSIGRNSKKISICKKTSLCCGRKTPPKGADIEKCKGCLIFKAMRANKGATPNNEEVQTNI